MSHCLRFSKDKAAASSLEKMKNPWTKHVLGEHTKEIERRCWPMCCADTNVCRLTWKFLRNSHIARLFSRFHAQRTKLSFSLKAWKLGLHVFSSRTPPRFIDRAGRCGSIFLKIWANNAARAAHTAPTCYTFYYSWWWWIFINNSWPRLDYKVNRTCCCRCECIHTEAHGIISWHTGKNSLALHSLIIH